jgi:hypothetical protein
VKCNLGKTDRLFRVVLGIIIIGTGSYLKSWWGVIGVIPFLTALVGVCPAYMPFNFSTCKCNGDCCCDKGEKKTAKK